MESISRESDLTKNIYDLELRLARALALELPYPKRPVVNRSLRNAAVMMLFAWKREEPDPYILLIRRSDFQAAVQADSQANFPDPHSGQMAFPGGVMEKSLGETPVACALRELWEEVGVQGNNIKIVGELPELLVPTGFKVRPIVGVLYLPIEQVELKTDPVEVADVFWVSWSGVFGSSGEFRVNGNLVWGATEAMIRNLWNRLQVVT